MLKFITFAIMHFTIAFSVAWFLTGDVLVGGLVATIEPAVNSIGYLIHERVWEKLSLKRLRDGANHYPRGLHA